MTRNKTVLTFAVFLFLVANCLGAEQQDLLRVVNRFLPAGGRLVNLEKFDAKSGKLLAHDPAILSGSIVARNSKDIVFAYETEAMDLGTRFLFFTLLHKDDSGYVKVFELTYSNQFLWVQDFSTVGFQLVRLSGTQKDYVLIATAVGASLGASVQVFGWDNDFGLTNLFPPNSGVRYFQLGQDGNLQFCELRFEKYVGEKEALPRKRLFWDGSRFRDPE